MTGPVVQQPCDATCLPYGATSVRNAIDDSRPAASAPGSGGNLAV